MADGSTDRYSHGHHESVVNQHARRTAEVDASILLPHLRSGMRLLDTGCGPGTITAGLALGVAPGETIGLDVVPEVLERAREHCQQRQVDNVRFVEGNVYALDFPDASFDVVYANQLLQHLTDPVAALREMHRVLKSGGLACVRDSDYATMCPSPKFDEFLEWNQLYHAVCYANQAEPDAGRELPRWFRAAGFSDLELLPNVVALDDEDARIWGRAWSQRILHSNVGQHALEYGLADQALLDRISSGWATWAESEAPFYMYAQMGILARR